jgi:hypothetical protein
VNYKKFNKIILITIGSLLGLIISFNYIIDPYYVFNSPKFENINKIKFSTIDSHMSKFYTAKRAKAKVLLIGTSRTEHINPKYLQKYYNDKIYNLGLLGSGIDVQRDNIKYFVEKEGVKTIFLGLDFFAFNPINVAKYKTIQDTRYSDNYFNDYLDSLLSIRTFRKSIKTLKSNLKSKHISMYYDTGWRSYYSNYQNIKKDGIEYIKKLSIKSLKLYTSKPYNLNHPPFKKPHSIDTPMNKLKEIINLCKKHNVELHMFISPIYSDMTDTIYSHGYGKTYDYWKRELCEYNNVYDFSGYNSITTDISNYIDGSHYQTKIAKIMLAKIFNDNSVNVPADFGIILNSKNIDSILLKQNNKVTLGK